MTIAKLSPSILTADFSNLGDAFRMFERHPSVGYIHYDVMDGDFVPNISFGPPVLKSIADKTSIPFDVHLMVTEAGRYVADYVTDNTEYITVHAEACLHLDRVLRLIKSLGVKCGVALNPATSPDVLDYVIDVVDQVLVMSVNPGFGGQKFIPSSMRKIKTLVEIRESLGLEFKIGVDGGISRDNIQEVAKVGADIIIAGSAILNAKDPEDEMCKFDELLGVNS